MNPIIIVQGGQWGSEAKGAVAAALCKERKVDYACRTGAVNAGHTVYKDGVEEPFKMQQLPTGWVYGAKCVIGPGALIHPDILAREVALMEKHGYDRTNIYIDSRAGLHTSEHTGRSAASGRHHSMGATGKGCSEALVDRVRLRGSGGRLFKDLPESGEYHLTDTTTLINRAYDSGAQILLEGTQGSLLDLYLGPYPYTTHKPTQAATWIQEMGLSPRLGYEVALVCRTYPIRVAGNSGPMPNEISWANLARCINDRLWYQGKPSLVSGGALDAWEEACRLAMSQFTIDPEFEDPDWKIEQYAQGEREKYQLLVSELHRRAFDLCDPLTQKELCKLFEFTTVTKKLRRVAEVDFNELRKAVMWNRPNYIVLTFLNYVFPEMWNATRIDGGEELDLYVGTWARETDCDVRYVSTGPRTEHFLEDQERNWMAPKVGAALPLATPYLRT